MDSFICLYREQSNKADDQHIRIAFIENGHMDRDTEDNIKQRFVAVLFRLRLMNRKYKKSLSLLKKQI